MEHKRTLRYDLKTKGALDFPPPDLDHERALRWVTEHTNKRLGLADGPDLSGGLSPSDEEAAFLLYYLYKHGDEDARLTEFHMLVPVGRPADGKVPCGYVVLRYLPNGTAAALLKRVDASLTASPSKPATRQAVEALRSEYGLGSVQAAGGAAWTEVELKKVKVAMAWLPAPHKVVLSGLTLVRVKEPADSREAGHFTWDSQGMNRLELSDRTFERDDVRFARQGVFVPAAFVGGLAKVGPQSLQSILHELGHAVEMYRLRVEATALKAASDAAHSKYEVLYKESQALQKSWSETRDRNPVEAERLSSAWKVKNEEADAAKSAFQDAEARYQKRAGEGSGRLSEFSEQVAARDTPITSYAATNATEFFAEAYAAWRADPEFLRANAPIAFAWFEALGRKEP
jgi:hypothetical protein